jgi:MinD-like ATPase involved in chromosome partitioning or flagellar assembly
VDGDRYDSHLSSLFSSNYVTGHDDVRPTLIPGLFLMTAETAASPSGWDIIRTRARDFSFVIVDFAATQSSDETAIESQHCHGVLFVVDPEHTRWHSALRAVRTLTDAGTRVVGAVLNKRRFPIPGWLYRTL